MDAKTNDRTFEEAPAEQEQPNFDELPEGEQQQQEPIELPVKLEHQLTTLTAPDGRPIQAHGEAITMLKWREPTGADIEMAGNPIYLDFSGPQPTITFNEKKMAAMMSRLCGVPPSTIRSISAKDWNAVAWALFRFFTPPGA